MSKKPCVWITVNPKDGEIDFWFRKSKKGYKLHLDIWNEQWMFQDFQDCEEYADYIHAPKELIKLLPTKLLEAAREKPQKLELRWMKGK
jgi:hypothetical protein